MKLKGRTDEQERADADFVVSYDREVGWWSFAPLRPEARAWLLEKSGANETIDGLNEEGARALTTRAREDGFGVHGGRPGRAVESVVHVTALRGEYAVTFVRNFGGGPLSYRRFADLDEVDRFLERELDVPADSRATALGELRQARRSTTIPSVRVTEERLRQLGLSTERA